MKSLLFSTVLMMFFTAFQVSAGEEWSLSKDKEGIKVYTRKYADYNYKEYKGITTIKGSVDEVITILKDVSGYDNWSYNCVSNSTKMLKEDNLAQEYYIYMEIKAPIVANRDAVSVYKFNPKARDGSVLVEFWGDADYIPKKDGLVRVPELKGFWKLIPVEGGKVKIIHQAFSHPGGNPPAGLVNNASISAPFSMLQKIRDIVEN